MCDIISHITDMCETLLFELRDDNEAVVALQRQGHILWAGI